MGNNFFSIASLFYNILLTLVYFSKKRINAFETRIYGYIVMSSLSTNIFAILCFFTIKYKDQLLVINDIVSKFLLINYLVWIMLFTIYMMGTAELINKENISAKTKSILMTVVLIMSAIFIMSPLYYHNENNMIYSYGHQEISV